MLANNIVGRTFVALLGPLGENQSAPWLFLFGERATAMVLGPNELALAAAPTDRRHPVAVGRVAHGVEARDRETGIIAASIAALSPLLLYYSNEVKPYGTDALVTATLVFVTLRVLEDAAGRRQWFILVFAGAVGLVAAFPAAFILPACWAALLSSANVRRSPHARRMLSLAAIVWTATLALPYVLVIRRVATDAFLTTYFSDRFLVPWRPGAFAALWGLWYDVSVEAFLGHDALASSPGAVAIVLSAAILAVCGVWLVGDLAAAWRCGCSAHDRARGDRARGVDGPGLSAHGAALDLHGAALRSARRRRRACRRYQSPARRVVASEHRGDGVPPRDRRC